MIRHLIGYAIGITFFVLLVPFGLYELSKVENSLFSTSLIDSEIFRYVVSIPIFACGILFIICSNIYLFKIGKGGPAEGLGISISPPTKKLVTSGPYRYSRNPMVFGVFSFYLSIAIFLNSAVCLILLLLLFIIAVTYLKFSEEKRLIEDFGEEYINYKKSVSMIFPIKRLNKNNI